MGPNLIQDHMQCSHIRNLFCQSFSTWTSPPFVQAMQKSQTDMVPTPRQDCNTDLHLSDYAKEVAGRPGSKREDSMVSWCKEG